MNKTDSGFPTQQVHAASPEAADVHPIIIRVAMIEHHYSASAGPQHAMNLAHGVHDVGCVVQHAMRINQIERVVVEVEILGIRSAKSSGKIEELKVLSRQLDRRIS